MYLKEFNDIVVKGMLGELLEDRFHVEWAGCSTQVCDDKEGCSVVAVQALNSEKSSRELGLSSASHSFQAADRCENYDI